jgi:spermidine synthase
LSIGAWWPGTRIETSARPGRWYALLELIIGLWGLALSLSLAWVTAALSRLIGEQPTVLMQWLAAFIAPTIILLPATIAMGATLPAAVRQAERARGSLEMIYAANTGRCGRRDPPDRLLVGAAARSPRHRHAHRRDRISPALPPLRGTRGDRSPAPGPTSAPVDAPALQHPSSLPVTARRHRTPRPLGAAACGLLGIGYETLTVRVLGGSPSIRSTLRPSPWRSSWPGTALGSALQQDAVSAADHRPMPRSTRPHRRRLPCSGSRHWP